MSDLAAPVRYQDRSTGLILVGILEIGLGLACLAMLAFMGLAVLSSGLVPESQAAGMSFRAMIGSGVFYLLTAVFFFTVGIGTLRGRRWARSIMLVVSWMWLIGGVFEVILMFFILPRMTAAISATAGRGGPAPDSGVGLMIMGCVSVVLGLLFIVLPGILVVFYRGANVNATFEAKDPTVPWTDRVPAPVLALTLLFGAGTVCVLAGISYAVLPLFGVLLTGVAAILGFLALGALSALLAWTLYQRRPAAWWGAFAWTVLGGVNGFFFFRNGGLRSLYTAMGTPAAQMALIEKMGIYDLWSHPAVLVVAAVGWLGWLGFLIWAKRFFERPPSCS
ncbi:MAG: hypothetical protein ACREMY_04625 [bacterium]